MKGAKAVAAVAALAGGASAGRLHHRHAHEIFGAKRMATAETCVPKCTTYVTTFYGEPTLYFPQMPTYTSASKPATTVTTQVAVVPTAAVETCPTPGTYTFPATTLTVTETTTVCGASSTKLPSGTHTVGGVTTVVETSTTVVCPYATTEVNSAGVTTSVIKETTYVCPSAGTYTIAPITTTVSTETVVVVPVVETYWPGTYTRPEVVTTVTETSVVVVCPFTSSGASPTTTSSVQPTSAAAKPSTWPAQSSSQPAAKPSESAATSVAQQSPTTSSAQASSTASSSKSVGGSGDHYAMTYTCYTNSGTCKSQDQVASDIAQIAAAGFSTVKVYSTDCDTLANVGAACASHGLKMILGVFISGAGCTNGSPDVQTQISAISAWAKWDLVELIVVGNEAIFGGYCTASELAAVITSAKSAFSKAGYTGPCTASEVLSVWQEPEVAAALCPVVDVTGANIHPYFNADTTAEQAGDFVAGQLALIDKICEGRTGINLECGWPSSGNCNGVACPSAANQVTAINSIREKAGSRTCFFSFTNDMWKEPGSCGCEQSWGCGDIFSS